MDDDLKTDSAESSRSRNCSSVSDSVTVQVDGHPVALPSPMVLEWQQSPKQTGVYVEYPRNGKKALRYVVTGDGTGPVADDATTRDATGSWWLGPIVVPQFFN